MPTSNTILPSIINGSVAAESLGRGASVRRPELAQCGPSARAMRHPREMSPSGMRASKSAEVFQAFMATQPAIKLAELAAALGEAGPDIEKYGRDFRDGLKPSGIGTEEMLADAGYVQIALDLLEMKKARILARRRTVPKLPVAIQAMIANERAAAVGGVVARAMADNSISADEHVDIGIHARIASRHYSEIAIASECESQRLKKAGT